MYRRTNYTLFPAFVAAAVAATDQAFLFTSLCNRSYVFSTGESVLRDVAAFFGNGFGLAYSMYISQLAREGAGGFLQLPSEEPTCHRVREAA